MLEQSEAEVHSTRWMWALGTSSSNGETVTHGQIVQTKGILTVSSAGGRRYWWHLIFCADRSCFQKSRDSVWCVFKNYLNMLLWLDLVSHEGLVTFRRLPEKQTTAKKSSGKIELLEKQFPSSCEMEAKKEGKKKLQCMYSPCTAKSTCLTKLRVNVLPLCIALHSS